MWKCYRLSECINIIGGGTPKTTNPEYWNGEIPWLTVSDFNNGKKYVNAAEKNITEKGLKGSSTKILKKGELILSARGTVGIVSMLGKDMAFNQSCYGIDAKREFTTNNYLYYLLKYKISDLQIGAHGAVFNTITRDSFEQIEVELPPLAEQKAIASVLSSLDDKIDLLHRQNQTLEALAETIFQKWFIVEEDKKWKELMIFELIDVKDGTHDSPKPTVKGYKLVTSKHLKPEGIDFQNAYYITEEDYDSINKRSRVEKNDILISMIGTLGLIHFVREDKIDYAIKNIGLFKTSQKPWIANYLYFLLRSPIGKTFVQENAVGSTQEYIPLGSLRKLQIKLPPSDLMENYNNAVDPIVKKVDKNKTQIRTLETLRDTLLPKLMSGEVRVQYDKAEVEKVI